MTIDRHLKHLAQKDPENRQKALLDVLIQEGLEFSLQEQEPSIQNPRGIRNYLLTPWRPEPSLLFCAHYDAVPGTFGANDNAAAVCILIQLAQTLKKEHIPARFAFFDGEEAGNMGSKFYVSSLDRTSLTGVINLDVCGYGDTIAICGKGHEKKPVMRPFCQKKLLESYRGQLLKYLPKSDDSSFRGLHLPVLSLAAVPLWDIQYLKTLASYGEGLLGRPPEFEMILGQMEVISTMHGGYRDTPERVSSDTMNQIYHYLLDGMHSPPVSSKRFIFF